MLLGNIADDTEVFRPVATFDSQPHYIVTTPDNQDVLEGLNMALEKIADSKPNFAEECYQANFPDSGTASIYINDEERAYIEQKKTVSIAVVENWHPLFCICLLYTSRCVYETGGQPDQQGYGYRTGHDDREEPGFHDGWDH